MNSNIVKSLSVKYPSGHPFLLPASVTVSTTTETAFLLSSGGAAVVGVPTGSEILGSIPSLDPNVNQARLGRHLDPQFIDHTADGFNASSFDAAPFYVRASGTVSAGATTTFSVGLYKGTSATLGSDTKIAATTAQTVNQGAKANWMVEATCLWDSASQILSGQYGWLVQNVVGSVTQITSVSSLALTGLNFLCSYVFSTASTTNACVLKELVIERI